MGPSTNKKPITAHMIIACIRGIVSHRFNFELSVCVCVFFF